MHTLFARLPFVRGMLLMAGDLLRRFEFGRQPPVPLDKDGTLVFWCSGAHSRRADEAARDRRTVP